MTDFEVLAAMLRRTDHLKEIHTAKNIIVEVSDLEFNCQPNHTITIGCCEGLKGNTTVFYFDSAGRLMTHGCF